MAMLDVDGVTGYASNLQQVFCAYYLCMPWLGLTLTALRYVLYFRFVDEVRPMFVT